MRQCPFIVRRYDYDVEARFCHEHCTAIALLCCFIQNQSWLNKVKAFLDDSTETVLSHDIRSLVSSSQHADQLHNFGLSFGQKNYRNAMKYWLECGKY